MWEGTPSSFKRTARAAGQGEVISAPVSLATTRPRAAPSVVRVPAVVNFRTGGADGSEKPYPEPNRASSTTAATARAIPTASVRLSDSPNRNTPMPVSSRIMHTA